MADAKETLPVHNRTDAHELPETALARTNPAQVQTRQNPNTEEGR